MSSIKSEVTPVTIHTLITEATSRIKDSMNQSNLAVRHNSYVDYCLLLIFACTGHRPIHDPIQDQNYFDLELGLMLVADKVVSEERAWRIVSLPEMGRHQLKYYQEYLPRLTGWLSFLPQSKDLVTQLNGLIRGERTQPFFFYLDELDPTKLVKITPKLMQERMSDFWKLPLNTFRHSIATELIRASFNQADLAQVQLGHITGSEHPFGAEATVSVLDKIKSIEGHVQLFLERLGWKALRSPLRKPTISINELGSLKDNKYLIVDLGYERRKEERKRKKQIVNSIVRGSIKEVLGDKRNLPTPEELNSIIDLSLKQAHEKNLSKNRCVVLIKRYVTRIEGGKKLLSGLNLNYEVNSEPSPFHENSLIDYRNTRLIRQRFLDRLTSQGRLKDPIELEQRLTEIVYSAALFSGLADSDKLDNLSESLVKTTFQYDGDLFVDISLTSEGKGVFRWYPDPISRTLIIGLYQSLKENKNNGHSYDSKKIKLNIKQLNRSLGITVSPTVSLLPIIKVAKAGVVFEVPGHIAQCLTGEINNVSLPLPQWIRYLSGKALLGQDEQVLKEKHLTEEWFVGARHFKKSPEQGDLKERKDFLSLLRTLFSQSKNIEPVKNVKNSTLYKTELVKATKEKFSEDEAQYWSQIPLAIASWVVHLCEEGTRSKKRLAFSTIDKYSFLVSRALLPLQFSGDFLTLDESSYEEIYLKALEIVPADRKHDLAGRLREFHSFLIDVFLVEEPNWSSIMPSGKNTSYADANIISEREYLQVLDAVQVDATIDTRTRNQYTVLLTLGYRFGLRFSEACHLRITDLQLSTKDSKPTTVLVQNTMHGDTKSEAGVRLVYLLEKLTDVEKNALTRMYEYSKMLFESHGEEALMAAPDGQRRLINRFDASKDLSYYIKTVTGDISLRFHHLRHSWATRFYSYFIGGEKGVSLTGTQNISGSISAEAIESFVHYYGTNAPLRSISTALGHRFSGTTLEYYIHSLDKVSQDSIRLEGYPVSMLGYAYALGISLANAKKRSERGQLYTIHPYVPTPQIKLRDYLDSQSVSKSKPNQDKKISLAEIDLLLLKFSQTKQSINRLADQLIIDQELAEKIVDVTAETERESGFEFYESEHVNLEHLYCDEVTDFSRTNYYKDENKRVVEIVNKLEPWVLALDEHQLSDFKKGLKVWRGTLKGIKNIITDKNERKHLESFVQSLPLGLKVVEVVSEDLGQQKKLEVNVISRASPLPKSLEKTKARQKSKLYLQIQPGETVKTSQTLGRIFILLSVYLETSELISN